MNTVQSGGGGSGGNYRGNNVGKSKTGGGLDLWEVINITNRACSYFFVYN